MISANRSTFVTSLIRQLTTGENLVQEGQAIVSVFENGIETVKPATGVANEAFMGFAVSESLVPTVGKMNEAFTIPGSPYTITLSKDIKTANPFGFIVVATNGTRKVIKLTAGTASATEVVISGRNVTFAAADTGLKVYAIYDYDITVAEALYKHEVNAFASFNPDVRDIGVFYEGELHTSMYDPSVDWSTFNAVTNKIKLAAGGVLTLGGSGTAIDWVVTALPEVNNGYLAVRKS